MIFLIHIFCIPLFLEKISVLIVLLYSLQQPIVHLHFPLEVSSPSNRQSLTKRQCGMFRFQCCIYSGSFVKQSSGYAEKIDLSNYHSFICESIKCPKVPEKVIRNKGIQKIDRNDGKFGVLRYKGVWFILYGMYAPLSCHIYQKKRMFPEGHT